MKARFTSVWDCGTRVVTDCEYNPDTGQVTNIEVADVDPSGT